MRRVLEIWGDWFKKFTSIHDRLALKMNRCLQGAHVPEWMTKYHTDPEGPNQRNRPKNFRPTTCKWMTRKILIVQIREDIYYPLTSRRLFLEEQKGCSKGSRGAGELDQHIINERKTRRKHLAMAWIDYKKTYDMVLHSWIINCLKCTKYQM